jgi:sterol desaturase/sphingolipid hydroxylase (fatty acid hydroxylase superfamily)
LNLFLEAHEAAIRLGAFLGLFAVMAVWEVLAPRRVLTVSKALRGLVVTPDMHRVHHSVEDDETNSNFGFNLSWWDRLLGTSRDQPRGGHQGITLGIRDYRVPREVSWLPGLLALPFRGGVTGYTIDRRRWQAKEEGGNA